MAAIQAERFHFPLRAPETFSIDHWNDDWGRVPYTYVAKLDRKIVSFITVLFDRHEPEAEIVWFYTKKGYQNKGFGRKLLGKVNSIFLRKKIRKVTLNATPESIKFYDKHSNYRFVGGRTFEWVPTPNLRVRIKRVRQKLNMAPQNVMRKDWAVRRK
jgi:ribosomal protein S18 acetylase RimI-like enzyme